MTDSWLQHLPTSLASLRRTIAARPPRNEGVTANAFGSGTLEFDDELAEELGVPFVFVRFEQLVGLFVGEEVEDQ